MGKHRRYCKENEFLYLQLNTNIYVLLSVIASKIIKM